MNKLLYQHGYHSITNDIYKTGTTFKNNFYPVYASFQGKVGNAETDYFSKHIESSIFMYHKPALIDSTRYTPQGKFENLMAVFQGYISSSLYKFKVKECDYFLNISGGYISDSEGNILLILCAKSDTISYTNSLMTLDNIIDSDNNPISENLILFVSIEFLKNEIYKNIFKKIEKEIIQFCYEKEIDVLYCSSKKIEDTVFCNDFKVSFDNLEELDRHLKEDVSEIYSFLFLSDVFGEGVESSSSEEGMLPADLPF